MAQIPIFTPTDITCPTNQEWGQYQTDVDNFFNQQEAIILGADPNAPVKAAPVAFTINPTDPTGRFNAAMRVTQWLANVQQEANAVLAATAAPLAQAGAPPGTPTMAQLMQMMIQVQQHQLNVQPGPRPIKTPMPNKFDGTPSKARTFLNACENYFVLNPMAANHRVRFALALMEGKAEYWTCTSLDSLKSTNPPAWENNWHLFKRHFNLRFGDRRERDRAY
jgi:hypothetical protein